MVSVISTASFSYILSLSTAEEQDAYLRDMLDPSNRDHADLMVEFAEKREEFSGREAPPPPGIAKVYRKKALDGEGEGRKKRVEAESAAAPPKREVLLYYILVIYLAIYIHA